MDFITATKRCQDDGNLVMVHPMYTAPFFVFPAAGSVYRDQNCLEWHPDVRDVLSPNWEIKHVKELES